MNCAEISELLSEHLDGELSDQQTTLVTEHLQDCDRCSRELASFAALSDLAGSLATPKAPPEIWDGLEQQLERDLAVERPRRVSSSHWTTYRAMVVAATLLVAVGIFASLFFPWGGHHHAMAHFSQYMDAFPNDPAAAQHHLLTSYAGRAATSEELAQVLKYTPVGMGSAPIGYSVDQSYLLNMPCCRCSQVVFRRDSGGFLALFEHDTSEQPDLFGDCPCVETVCNGNPCTLVQTENHITASCEVGGRHFTIVGAGDIEEIQTFVAWLEDETKAKAANS